MTAWSAARLALKIVRFTPSAGSLSESASPALGEVAQPLESSSRPKTTAAADRILPPRYALQNGRTTLTFSAIANLAEAHCPGRHTPRQDTGRKTCPSIR